MYIYFLMIHITLLFSEVNNVPPFKLHPLFLFLTNPTPTPLVFVFCYNQLQHLHASLFLVSVTHPHYIPSKDDVKAMKTDVAHTNCQHLQENSKSASTKRRTIREGNATRRKTGNLYWETGSVYFYLINVNLLSH